MRPADLKTIHPSFRSKIFVDGGNPEETRAIIDTLGFLDGQTTNPTLISKNPQVAERLARGEKFSQEEILNFYKEIVTELSQLMPDGSISIEVVADKNTSADEMFEMGKDMSGWIPNAHIKFPTSNEGLKAAEMAVGEGIRVNMTLCFSQEQAAAVYAATKETGEPTLPGFKNVFVSPFIGRLDDKGENGMDLIKNIIRMYKDGDSHVEVLTASVRNLNHFLYALALGSDIITVPVTVLGEWVKSGMAVPDENFSYNGGNLEPIPYQELDLNKDWQKFDIKHDLTDAGIDRFTTDWNGLLK